MIISEFIEQRKSQIDITCNGKKPLARSKAMVVLLNGVTNKPLTDISKELDLSYGVVRKWKTEEALRKSIRAIQDEVVELLLDKIQKKQFDILDLSILNDEIRGRVIERILGMISVVSSTPEKIYHVLFLKKYLNYCDCDLMESLLIESLK